VSVATTWGSTPAERAASLPCDRLVPGRHDVYNRGISVQAPPEVIFRWICQLRVAPYSYDWIDNFGRRSPRELTPGIERLTPGQRVMRTFEIVSFEPGRHITVISRGNGLFRHVAVTYAVGHDERGPRLLARVCVGRDRPLGWFVRPLLPWGDWIMMRKQLRTLRDLAERDASVARHDSSW
jgi:hypothetical protein